MVNFSLVKPKSAIFSCLTKTHFTAPVTNNENSYHVHLGWF